MTTLDEERFSALADAYGGDLRRWPAPFRTQAEALAAADPVSAERLLFAARQLDAALNLSRRVEVGHDLRQAVLARAPSVRGGAVAPDAARRWLVGLGLATACACGVLAGIGGMERLDRSGQADTVLAQAAGYDDGGELLG